MLFNSISFLYYFLPVLIIIYFITPKKYKNIILLIASLLFYLYGEPKYVFLMIAEIIIAYWYDTSKVDRLNIKFCYFGGIFYV